MKSFKKLVTVIAMLTIALSALAQNVTIKANQVRLETVLDQITSQTGYTFVHSRPAVNPDQLVTLEVSGVSLEAALQKLFADTSIIYEIQGKKIYLKEKTLQASANPAKKKITGIVVDDSGLVERPLHFRLIVDAFLRAAKQHVAGDDLPLGDVKGLVQVPRLRQPAKVEWRDVIDDRLVRSRDHAAKTDGIIPEVVRLPDLDDLHTGRLRQKHEAVLRYLDNFFLRL